MTWLTDRTMTTRRTWSSRARSWSGPSSNGPSAGRRTAVGRDGSSPLTAGVDEDAAARLVGTASSPTPRPANGSRGPGRPTSHGSSNVASVRPGASRWSSQPPKPLTRSTPWWAPPARSPRASSRATSRIRTTRARRTALGPVESMRVARSRMTTPTSTPFTTPSEPAPEVRGLRTMMPRAAAVSAQVAARVLVKHRASAQVAARVLGRRPAPARPSGRLAASPSDFRPRDPSASLPAWQPHDLAPPPTSPGPGPAPRREQPPTSPTAPPPPPRPDARHHLAAEQQPGAERHPDRRHQPARQHPQCPQHPRHASPASASEDSPWQPRH